jgi:hypothetical protein
MKKYEEDWRRLDLELRALESESGNLRASLAALQTHQLDSGFIRGDLEAIERINFCHPRKGAPCLRIQYNPNRATRFLGAGVHTPPDRDSIKNDGCYLCRDNIRWQQRGKQFGYQVEVNGNPYIAWMNPFPLLPGHMVMATEEHISQEWSLHPNGEMQPGRIIADLLELVARAPGYAGFYNGVGAGTSIPAHMHYHFFHPLTEHGKFPLEVQAIDARNEQPGLLHWRLGHYPLEAMHWHGAPEDIIEPAIHWLSRWAGCQPHLPELSSNILAISEDQGDEVSLFFVPRHRKRNQLSCMSGLVGGLEVLGELVFSSEEDKLLLDSGRLDYFNLEQVLAEVCTPLNMP